MTRKSETYLTGSTCESLTIITEFEYAAWMKSMGGKTNAVGIVFRVAISKRITPHPSTRTKPGNHHYCFVDFETQDDAEDAIRVLDGRCVPGGRLRVSMAHGLPISARD